jgi:alkylhydroperoxidase/carboxymuconolactone decarboxylase family protein YurZ
VITDGTWAETLVLLQRWDPSWARACSDLGAHPVRSGVLDARFAALVGVALNAACTAGDAAATRHHVGAALDAGATRAEIVFVVKCATVVALHSLSVAGPIVARESAGTAVVTTDAPTPACDALRAAGQWNPDWDAFADLDPAWTEKFMTLGIDIYGAAPLCPKEIELLSIALDASVTHLYTPGISRHVRAALDLGATVADVAAVLQLCVGQGLQACTLAIPILDDELARRQACPEPN